jgi:hypothetical protein
MARWATICKIADVDFTGCRATLVDAHQFNTEFVGSVDWVNTGKAESQIVHRGVAGIQFGIAMTSAEMTKCQSTLTAIQTTQMSNTLFVVNIAEGLYTLDLWVKPDYTAPEGWFTYEKHSEGMLENVLWRFISDSVHEEGP